MDTCVRNGLYDEALDLSDFISNIVRRHDLQTSAERPQHGGNGREDILLDLVYEARDSLRFMRENLLNQLKGKVGSGCIDGWMLGDGCWFLRRFVTS
jgi:hypothetical protein